MVVGPKVAFTIGAEMGLTPTILDVALAALGGNRESSAEEVGDTPEVCAAHALRVVVHNGSALPPMAVGRLVKWTKRCKEAASGASTAVVARVGGRWCNERLPHHQPPRRAEEQEDKPTVAAL